jgi:hypothetical protein
MHTQISGLVEVFVIPLIHYMSHNLIIDPFETLWTVDTSEKLVWKCSKQDNGKKPCKFHTSRVEALPVKAFSLTLMSILCPPLFYMAFH